MTHFHGISFAHSPGGALFYFFSVPSKVFLLLQTSQAVLFRSLSALTPRVSVKTQLVAENKYETIKWTVPKVQ